MGKEIMSTLNPAGEEKRLRKRGNNSFDPTVHYNHVKSVSCVRINCMRGQIRGEWPRGQMI